MEQQLENIEQAIKDIRWYLAVRKESKLNKFDLLYQKCPCCVGRIISNYWMFSDLQLHDKLNGLVIEQEILINQININDITNDTKTP